MKKNKLFSEDELVKAQTEIEFLKKDLKDSDNYYVKLAINFQKKKEEVERLEKELDDIFEDGTEEHNAAVDLRSNLAQSRLETDEWKKVARQLYSVALQLQAVANSRCNIVVVGPGLYSESVESIKEYEKLQND